MRQPCKSCGKDDAVREFGLMCEDCQRESKFTVSGKSLHEHLMKAQEQDAANLERLKAENERNLAAHKQQAMEHREWCERRDAEMNTLAVDRMKRDQLHRLYTTLFNYNLETSNRHAAPSHCEEALRQARRAQEFFEKEVAE